MSRDCIRAEPTELSARQRRLPVSLAELAALDSWREIMHEPDLLAGTLADLPWIRKPVTNQVTTSVRRVRQAVLGSFCYGCGWCPDLGFLLRLPLVPRLPRAGGRRDLAEGLAKIRAGMMGCHAARFRRPSPGSSRST
jgi:hypothetical protein